MTLRPCLTCGEPSAAPRCPDHTVTPSRHRAPGHVHGNTTRWKALSLKARNAQPWCSQCDATTDLCSDHIIPFSVAPELGHTIENVQVLCRRCNGARGNRYTEDDVRTVLQRLQAAYDRRPTRGGRERLAVAQRALETRGGAPLADVPRSPVSRGGQ